MSRTFQAAVNPAHLSAIAPSPPLAGLEAFKAWQDTIDPRGRSRGSLTPAQYRRIALARREGTAWNEIARLTGKKAASVKAAWDRLPEDLR